MGKNIIGGNIYDSQENWGSRERGSCKEKAQWSEVAHVSQGIITIPL